MITTSSLTTKTSLTPIDVLPPELLKKIFVLCSASDTITHPRKNKAPWVLTQVCSAWRRLAIGHSELWSSITISVNNPNYPGTWVYSEGEEVSALCDPPLYVIKTYLARSRTSPLNVDLSFLFTDWEDNFPSSVPRNVIRLLHTHMDHTKSISIYIPESYDPIDPKEPLFPALIAAPNVLETLHLAHKSRLAHLLARAVMLFEAQYLYYHL